MTRPAIAMAKVIQMPTSRLHRLLPIPRWRTSADEGNDPGVMTNAPGPSRDAAGGGERRISKNCRSPEGKETLRTG